MAELFTWDEGKYSVWVKQMDEEHKKLIEIMNRLYAKNDAGAPKAELTAVATELANYTVKHFGDEEKYMESIQFAGIDTHKAIHKDLLSKFSAHLDKFKKDASPKLGPDFFLFLKTWLGAHIQGIDRKYGEASTKKKAA